MELIKSSLKTMRIMLDSARNYEETTDAIVPDTFPDIGRIAAVYGSAQVKDDAPQSGRLLVSGSVRMTVLYVPEDSTELKKLEIPVSFAHIEECRSITEQTLTFVTCRVISADARIVNSRKLAVTAMLSISCRAFEPAEEEITSAVEDSENRLEILPSEHTVTLPVAVLRREFTVMEDMELANSAEYTALTAPRGELRLNECRLTNGKAVLRGEAVLRNLAITQEGALKPVDTVVPFTQIFEASEFSEGQQIGVCFCIRHLDCELDDTGTLTVGIGCCALLTAYETRSITSIADIYHLDHPLKTEVRPLELAAGHPVSDLSCEASETVPAGMKVTSVADVTAALDCLISEPSRTVLRLMCAIVYRSDDDQYYTIHRAVSVPLILPDGSTSVHLTGLLTRASASISGEDSIVLSISGRCSLISEDPVHLSDLTSLDILEDASDADGRDAVSLILRYVESEERLWDIAKSYRTTVDAIRQANHIGGDCHSAHGQMLLIPMR
ncbi:MAG: SPOCS domain-containing protein [Butyricicoccaceae bacterium]